MPPTDPAGDTVGNPFRFPFKPYGIQEDFMRALYECLERGRIGIFESPTGTGKSLSLICGTLKWLRDTQAKVKGDLERQIEDLETQIAQVDRECGGDWIASHGRKQGITEDLARAKKELDRIHKYERRNCDLRESRKALKLKARIIFRAGKRKNPMSPGGGGDESSGPHSDQDLAEQAAKKLRVDIEQLREEMDFLIEYNSDKEDEEDHDEYPSHGRNQKDLLDGDQDEDDRPFPTIYFCSRTHSQLSQFIGEIKRTHYVRETIVMNPSRPPDGLNSGDIQHLPTMDGIVRVAALGSRASLCINPAVTRLGSINMMNEKCLDLLQSKAKAKAATTTANKDKSCEFFRRSVMNTVRDEALATVQDIEQVQEAGRRHRACPYFASRYAATEAEIVVLPYNILLNDRARESFKLKLNPQRDVVIIDEAHNLLETIVGIHTIEIGLQSLADTYQQVTAYLNKYKSRLAAKNVLYIKQLLAVVGRLIRFMKPDGGGPPGTTPATANGPKDAATVDTRVLEPNSFLITLQLDHINLFKLIEFCRKSELARKLYGFSAHKKNAAAKATAVVDQVQVQDKNNGVKDQDTDKDRTRPISSMYQIIELLECLTRPSSDGRLFAFRDRADPKRSSYKYVPLNPAAHFRDVARSCRSLILAGGTMEPISDFVNQLFQPLNIPAERLHRFSCGHVIPAANLRALSIGRSPSGQLLDFSYQNRHRPEVVLGAGRLLAEVARRIPGGLVCFFVSYEYEEKLFQIWSSAGLVRDLEAKSGKRLFREPRRATEVNACLEEYTKAIRLARARQAVGQATMTDKKDPQEEAAKGPGGAILFSVIGGKMSEGINFGDDLARAVVVFGLPYANIKSPELAEKMKYLDGLVDRGGSIYYENQCLKALNQSIGRAIRHRNDYAMILLVDQRFGSAAAAGRRTGSIQRSLPNWIQPHFAITEQFSEVTQEVDKFFSVQRSAD